MTTVTHTISSVAGPRRRHSPAVGRHGGGLRARLVPREPGGGRAREARAGESCVRQQGRLRDARLRMGYFNDTHRS